MLFRQKSQILYLTPYKIQLLYVVFSQKNLQYVVLKSRRNKKQYKSQETVYTNGAVVLISSLLCKEHFVNFFFFKNSNQLIEIIIGKNRTENLQCSTKILLKRRLVREDVNYIENINFTWKMKLQRTLFHKNI